MPPEFAVEIDRLYKRFGDFVAVNDVSLTVRRGEIFGFLGPNGAGKSTTIRVLCGLLTPSQAPQTMRGFTYASGLIASPAPSIGRPAASKNHRHVALLASAPNWNGCTT